MKCGVFECDREASVMRRSWLTRGFSAMREIFPPYVDDHTQRIRRSVIKCLIIYGAKSK